ncbi:hypothetical protein HNR07_000220 [Nocardiopsis metallicus]|uniref:Uncharacterized protein n=1 Tax=Nocardiopsis metallicus TaxID=179819 RepID=A0A840W1D4_9ACTN|nr:hypothetical protein [Nocardiopsis metallicus]
MILLPAHAGMDPVCCRRAAMDDPAPRARGDGPVRLKGTPMTMDCSPRTLGCFIPI